MALYEEFRGAAWRDTRQTPTVDAQHKGSCIGVGHMMQVASGYQGPSPRKSFAEL